MSIAPVIAALSVMLASLAGVIFATKTLGAWMRHHLTYFATFSAGVLVVLAYHLIEEAFHEAESVVLVDGRRVLLSDAIHNITDGIILVPAFIVDWKIGVAATLGIFLH